MSKIYGPYYREDGRQHIVIVHDDGRKQTKSYPKYLLEQKLGRELVDDETCDHQDDDFTNDNPDNLQVLTRSENATKAMIGHERAMFDFVCPVCRQPASQELRHVKHNRKKGSPGPFCSKECASLTGRGRNYIRTETAYDYDPVTQAVTVQSESWELP